MSTWNAVESRLENFLKSNWQSAASGDIDNVCDLVLEGLLSNRQEVTKTVSNDLSELVISVSVEAIRHALSPEDLAQRLQRFSDPLCKAILQAYTKHDHQLRSLVCSIKWEYPEIVGHDWKVGRRTQSNSLGAIDEPFVEMGMELLAVGQVNSTNLSFSCDRDALQDFHWKLKEAQNVLAQLQRGK